jgi:glycosyltransferase involved in cell wall biosynthesis
MPGPTLPVLFLQGAGFRAGAERALLARIRHLPEHGIEPVVAFMAEGPFRQEVERGGVETILLGRTPHLRDLTRLPAAIREIGSVARARHVHVIEGCGEKMSFLAGWAARLAHCACVYNLQDAPRRNARATGVQLAAMLGRHDAVVVPSRWMARAFRRSWGVRPSVIPNAVVLEELPDQPADVCALAGWPQGSAVVGLFGRLVAWKGTDVLLRAAQRVRASHEHARFLVAGGSLYGWEPEYRNRVRQLAQELGLADRVYFADHREDALELMSGCDVVCHCSLEPEPFGMVVLEAMALGKPVVATRTGGPEELIDHGRTGMLVEPGDDLGLAAEIASIVDDAARRDQLGSAARSVARYRFGSAAVGVSLGALYGEVAARRSD